MDIFVGRQPILTKDEEIIAYELLYRNSYKNSFSEVDGDAATIDLLLNSFIGFGNQKLSRGKKLYINFTKNLLLRRVPCLFSPKKIVIEILEDVEGDPDILKALAEFKQLGYTIALDDFKLKDVNKNLIPFADMIKIDFLKTSLVQRKVLHNIAKKNNILLLAEKIETRIDFHTALKEDFDFYQGYFFSKPVILSTRDIPFYTNDYLQLLQELQQPEPLIDKITMKIQHDLSLSYKLLKIVNTMAHYTRVKVTSIKQAVLILGLNELMKIITIISLKEQSDQSSLSKEILIQTFTRARLSEVFGEFLFGEDKKSECFLLGMFSLLDVILKQPMDKALNVLPLSDDIKNALLGNKNHFSELLQYILYIERAQWNFLEQIAPKLAPLSLSKSYQEALQWALKMNEHVDHASKNLKYFP